MLTQLESYRPSPLESSVVDFYRKRHVQSPQDIDLEMFAYDAGIWIHFMDSSSTNYHIRGNMYSVVVDRRLPWNQQRVELAHELGHVLLHAGRQEFMTDDFRALQEWQADRFAAYALVPTFMLSNYIVHASSRQQLVSCLSQNFDVPEPFMEGRLTLLEQRLQNLAAQEQMASAIREATAGYDYAYRHPFNPRIEYLVQDGNIVGRRLRADT